MRYLDKFMPRKSGVVGRGVHAAVDAAVPAAMIGGFGYAMNRWRDKAHVKNVPVDLAAGVAGLVASTFGVFSFLGRKVGVRSGHSLDKLAGFVATAGLGSYAHTYGAGIGGQQSGVTRVAVDKKDVPKIRAAVPSATVLGSIGRAPHGDMLSSSELRDLARS